LDPTTKVALILNTHLGTKELLTTVLDDLEIEYKSTSKSHLLSALNKYLLDQISKDINVVLVIDEAQNLTPSVLEEVRMLSNLETEREKLIQIVLMGQPELKKKLALPQLEQFRQRIVFHYHLSPLDREETRGYIKHRLRTAGNEKADLFMEYAIDEVYRYSKGVPRLINIICHNALISGLACGERVISCSLIESTIKELIHWAAGSDNNEQKTVTETIPQEDKKEEVEWVV
jgi:general secretion pathway protein A